MNEILIDDNGDFCVYCIRTRVDVLEGSVYTNHGILRMLIVGVNIFSNITQKALLIIVTGFGNRTTQTVINSNRIKIIISVLRFVLILRIN